MSTLVVRALLPLWLLCLGMGAHAFPTAPYYPFYPGNSWTGDEDGCVRTETVSATNVVLSNGVTAIAISSTQGDIGYVLSDGNGLREAGASSLAPGLPTTLMQIFNPPPVDLPADATLGQATDSSGTAVFTYVGYGSVSANYTMRSTPVAFESVTVPAGTFNALRVEQQVSLTAAPGDTRAAGLSYTGTQTVWLASGVGQVKYQSTVTFGGTTERHTYVLHSYNVSIPDATPDAFAIPPVRDAVPGALVESGSIAITGIDTPASISANGGEYSIDSSNYTAAPGTIAPGSRVRVRQTAGGNWGQTTSAVLSVGSVSASFDVTTLPHVPDGNVIYFSSQPGDRIGQGKKQILASDTGYTVTGTASLNDAWSAPSVTFTVAGPTPWRLTLRSPDNQPLQVRSYESALSPTFVPVGSPGVAFSGDGPICSEVSGRFDVLEAVYAAGALQKFAANFEQHCEKAVPALRGQVRFNSAIPIDFGAPPLAALGAGWNLIGNSRSTPLHVADLFGDGSRVLSVWKWVPKRSTWAFYSAALPDGGAAYAAAKGYDNLITVEAGEGYWVNAAVPLWLQVPMGTAVTTATVQDALVSGWNLVSVGSDHTPRQVNGAFHTLPPGTETVPANIITLWAWDNARKNWYFYSPKLDAKGGTALSDYIGGRGYLDLMAEGKRLGAGMGLWLNMP